jgi:hypothetical protein
MRYAATYTFFLESYEDAAIRLKNFVEKAAQATLSGDVFDDAATGQGLLNYFLKAVNCGAITEEEALVTGLTLEEIRSRSFPAQFRDHLCGDTKELRNTPIRVPYLSSPFETTTIASSYAWRERYWWQLVGLRIRLSISSETSFQSSAVKLQ